LGTSTQADLEIRWPNGGKETVAKVPADHLIVIKEGAGVIKTEAFQGAGRPTAGSPS
jgi:hypothetical protein